MRAQQCYRCGNSVNVPKFGSYLKLCDRCESWWSRVEGKPPQPVALRRKALPKKVQLKQRFIRSFCRQVVPLVKVSDDNLQWALALHRSKFFSIEEIKQYTDADKGLLRWLATQEQTGERQLFWLLSEEGHMMRDYRNVDGVAIRNAQGGGACETTVKTTL